MERNVQPHLLELARESRGMSQAQLARAISATQSKVSKYENGLLNVSADDLDKITRVLDYTADFFVQEDKVYGLGAAFLFHRQRKTTPVSLQKKIEAKINILRMQVERLLRSVEIETELQFQPLDPDAYNGNAAKVARMVRAAWRLPTGPVADVTGAVESAGGIVLKCRFGTDMIDGAHLWVPGLPPMFFLNIDAPGDRMRWNLAHEVGHAFMHRFPTEKMEDEAHRFAAEFLLPKHEIAPHLVDLTLERAAILKHEWKVSMAAIIMRARDLGIITERKFRTLFTSLSAQGYKTNEPFPIPVEEPQLVRRLVEYHRTELSYDEFDLARLLFAPDPQFFKTQEGPALMRLDGRPFFAFFPNTGGGPRREAR